MTGDDEEERTLALLIPFYLNNSLAAEEGERLERALAADPALREELEASRSLEALVREGGAALYAGGGDPEARLKRLMARIASAPPPARRRSRELSDRRPSRPLRLQVSWKAAFAASAALVILQAGAITWQVSQSREVYGALAGKSPAAPEKAQLIVTFSPDAPWSAVEALLASRGLEIVGGPRGGTVDLAARAGVSPEDDLKALRASPLVEFAGPASR